MLSPNLASELSASVEVLISEKGSIKCNLRIDPERPREFSWVKMHKVSPVKDQGICGSCYVFAAVGTLESQFMLNYNTRIDLSEQSVLNCLETGCDGGWPYDVWKEINKTGVSYSHQDPYHGSKVSQNSTENPITYNYTGWPV